MKSNVSDYLELLHSIYRDACNKCIADVSDLRDLETIRSRVKDEGLSFLTITLPAFCVDFERSLANGFIDPTCFRSFRKHGPIPAFLQGMVGLIFDRETGRLEDYEITSDFIPIVEGVRQICLTFKKLEVACTLSRVRASLANFVSIEREFSMFQVPDADISVFNRVSDCLWGAVIGDLSLNNCSPRHGPGATAEHISGNAKYTWQSWHERLEPYFPFVDSAYPLGVSALDSKELEMVTFVAPDDEQPVRVVQVPKTLKSPRIIAIEPCCAQYVQQGISRALYRVLESNWLTSGHINFRDQSINQSLAMSSSFDGRLATIDLSDASDRVPRDLAMGMFRTNPDLRDAIDACRSTRAEMPDGTIIGPLNKFASMGSALCFPVEAMYFYTICVIALLGEHKLSVSHRNINTVSRGIYVYGDDILVPTDNAIAVLDCLQKYRCKVNSNKTFVSGSFRESCGVDAFRGEEVTPLYIRKTRPENRQHADRLISWTATANAFYKKGYWQTATLMFKTLEKVLGPMPYLSETSPGLGRTSFLGYRSVERWSRALQRFEVKAWVPGPVHRADVLEGFGALMKCFLKLEDLKNPLGGRDAQHLEHSALHHAVALKRGWVPTQ